jgi:hypothetical protein
MKKITYDIHNWLGFRGAAEDDRLRFLMDIGFVFDENQTWKSLKKVFYEDDKQYRVLIWNYYQGFYITERLSPYGRHPDNDIGVSSEWVFDNVLCEEEQKYVIFNMDVFVKLDYQDKVTTGFKAMEQ